MSVRVYLAGHTDQIMIEILTAVGLDTGLGAIGLVQDVAHHYLALGLQRNSIEIEGACGSFVAEANKCGIFGNGCTERQNER